MHQALSNIFAPDDLYMVTWREVQQMWCNPYLSESCTSHLFADRDAYLSDAISTYLSQPETKIAIELFVLIFNYVTNNEEEVK